MDCIPDIIVISQQRPTDDVGNTFIFNAFTECHLPLVAVETY